MKRLVFLLGLLGCGDDAPTRLPPTDPATLRATLDGLSQFGPKHVGTMAGAMAGDWVQEKMQSLGLKDVHFEPFAFPRHDVSSSAFSITGLDSPGFDVFDGSGSGHAEGDVVYVHEGYPSDLTTTPVAGKIALVDRSTAIHRSVQFSNLANAGALAMLYVSMTPDNLRQVGSVRLSAGDAIGPTPALCIGSDDGTSIKNALAAGQTVHAIIDVAATAVPATGRNVVGMVAGTEPGQIVLGAHYDSWFTGSVDNGGGVAAVLGLAARRVKEAQPRYTLVFVAYDGEEVGLYGGYDYLRKHHIVARDPILAVLNFEMPASADATTLGLAHSNVPPLDDAMHSAGLQYLYPFYVAMDVVPTLFAGVIPTDIQGTYRNGVPTATTATDTAWYHTTSDTPDKVDVKMLARSVDEFDLALDALLRIDAANFAVYDAKLWRAAVVVQPAAAGQDVPVEVTLTDSAGMPQADTTARYELFVDDFFRTASGAAKTDGSGKATFTLPAAAVAQGAGNRFLHVTAGPNWPLVESITALP